MSRPNSMPFAFATALTAIFILVTLFNSENTLARTSPSFCAALFTSPQNEIDKILVRPRVDSFFEKFHRRDDKKHYVTRHKPSHGPGSIWVIRFNQRTSYRVLYILARRYPVFFRRLEINAVESGPEGLQTLTMPDSARLNWLRSQNGNPGFTYRDRELWRKQPYTNEEFFSSIRRRLITLATHGEFYIHDRIEEHLVGALLLPDFVTEGLIHSASVIEKLSSRSSARSGPFRRELDRIKLSFGETWDATTLRFGTLVDLQKLKSSKPSDLLPTYEEKIRPAPGVDVGATIDQWIRTLTFTVNTIYDAPEAALIAAGRAEGLEGQIRLEFESLRNMKPNAGQIEAAALTKYSELTGRERAEIEKSFHQWRRERALRSSPSVESKAPAFER